MVPIPKSFEDQFAAIVDLRKTLVVNGFWPVPVKEKDKGPRIKDWTTFRPSIQQIAGQARKHSDHTGTGIVTGEIVAIDIDAPDPETAAGLIEIADKLPGADRALRRVGKAPKVLLVFRATEARKKMSSQRYRVGEHECQVEVLGRGQQFVAFGTHPDTGKPYTWLTQTPLEVPLADLPEITPDTIDAFVAEAEAFLASRGTPVKPKKAPQPPAKSGGTFWQQVNAAALATPEKWVRDLFPSARQESGTGAWRVSSKDLGRALEEDISIHQDGVQDFGLEKPATPTQLVIDYGGAPSPKDAAHWLCEKLGIDPADLGWETRQPVAMKFGTMGNPPAAANDDNEEWRKEEEELFRSDSTLRDLTRPGGFIEELIDWIVSSAEHPSRELALSAVIPFVGALIGRRFAGYRDARSNIYSIALAPSGYGKDHARQQIKRLIASENLHQFSGPARIMSASGLRAALMEKPSISCMIDEIGGPLREMLDPRANQHQAMIKNDLLEYFSTASTYFEGAAYAQIKAIRLENPNLCIYGTSTPDDFWNAMSSLSTRDGFMARLLLFNIEGNKPDLVVPENDVKHIPKAIKARAKALAMAGRTASLDVPATDSGEKPRKATQVPLTAEAEARRLDFKGDIEKRLRKASPSDCTVLNRAVEHAVKLALIVAVATDCDDPEITERQMSWAIQVAWLSCVALMKESRLNVADSLREKNFNKVLKLIMDAGTKGITMGRLTDKTRGIDKRQREEILIDLGETGRVDGRHVPAGAGGGRPAFTFFAR
jgi:hypothetical protein